MMGERSVVIEEMAQQFRSGKIVDRCLDRHGISTMTVSYLGSDLTCRWYSSGNIESLIYEGRRYFASSKDAEYIGNAAKARADSLFDESIAAIEKKRDEYNKGKK